MKKENKRILIATGGTGGHIFPSLSLADFLKTKHRVEIVTDKRGLKYLAIDKKINIRTINSDTIFVIKKDSSSQSSKVKEAEKKKIKVMTLDTFLKNKDKFIKSA